MRRKFKRCMAVMLAVSTIMSSIPVEYAFAEESSTEVVTEFTTESTTELNSGSDDGSGTGSDVGSGSGETVPSETSVEKETSGTGEDASVDDNSSDESADEYTDDGAGETAVTESEKETEKVTEATTESSEKTTEKETEEDTESEKVTEKETEEVTETEVVKGKVTFLAASKGGKIIVKDTSGNVIKEVAFVEDGIPYEVEKEEGEVIDVEIVTDGEGYEVGTYRLTLDSGAEKENTVFDEGTATVSRKITVSEETQNVVVTFNEVEKETETETEDVTEKVTEVETEVETDVETEVETEIEEETDILEDVESVEEPKQEEGYPVQYSINTYRESVWNGDKYLDLSSYSRYENVVSEISEGTLVDVITLDDGDTFKLKYKVCLAEDASYVWYESITFVVVNDISLASVKSDKADLLIPDWIPDTGAELGIPEFVGDTLTGKEYTVYVGDESFDIQAITNGYDMTVFRQGVSDYGDFDVNTVGSYKVIYVVTYFMKPNYYWYVESTINVVEEEVGNEISVESDTIKVAYSDNEVSGEEVSFGAKYVTKGNEFVLNITPVNTHILNAIEPIVEVSLDGNDVEGVVSSIEAEEGFAFNVFLPEGSDGYVITVKDNANYSSYNPVKGGYLGAWNEVDDEMLEGLEVEEAEQFLTSVSGLEIDSKESYAFKNVASKTWSSAGQGISTLRTAGTVLSGGSITGIGVKIKESKVDTIYNWVAAQSPTFDSDALASIKTWLDNLSVSAYCNSDGEYESAAAGWYGWNDFAWSITAKLQYNETTSKCKLTITAFANKAETGNYQYMRGSKSKTASASTYKITVYKRLRDETWTKNFSNISLSAVFTLYEADGTEVDTAKIDFTGTDTTRASVEFTDGLEAGDYILKETYYSNGCISNTDEYEITLTEEKPEWSPEDYTGTATSISGNYVVNSAYYYDGYLAKKLDATTKQPISGAIFEVKYETKVGGTVEGTWYLKSDENGYVKLDADHLVSSFNGKTSDDLPYINTTLVALPVGAVKIQEVAVSDSAKYELNTTVFETSFTKTSTTVRKLGYTVPEVDNVPKQGDIEIYKVDANTGTKDGISGYTMDGATYTVYDKDGKVADTIIIKDGYGKSKLLDYGDYTVKETKSPPGYDLDTTIHKVAVPSGGTIKVTSTDAPIPGYVKVKKTSTRPEVTIGNSMYSFEGAKFGVYSDSACTKQVGTLTADATGETGTVELYAGTYYVKELEPAPKGYKLNTKVYPVIVTYDRSIKTVEISDEPLVGVLDISLVAKQNDCATTRSLEGANFQVNFYGSDKAEGAPLRSWVLSTDQEGYAYLQSIYKVSGDALYGENLLPLGTIEVKEIKAPEGYVINSTDVKSYTLTQNNTTGTVEMPEVTPVNIVDITEYGGVKIKKVDNDTGSVQGDATLEGATYAIIVNDDDTLTRSSDMNTDVAFAKGEEIYRITTDENGIAQTPTVDVRGTEYQLLQSGKYVVKEVDPSTGYLLPDWSLEFEITENGQVVDLTGNTCKEPIIRGGFVIYKGDAELREIYSQGDSSLANAEFTLINKSENVVTVDTDNDGTLEEYASGAVIMKVYTDENGKYTSPEKLLPYGTYELKETNVPEGYLLEGISLTRTFSIRSEGEVKKFAVADKTATSDNGATLDNVIRGGVRVSKWDVELDVENKVQGDATLEKAEFTIYNRSAHDVLVDTDGDGEFERYKVNDEITKIYTNEKGVAETSSEFLPYGTYEVKETRSPTGYTMLGKNLIRTVSIREDGKIYEFTSTDSATKNEVIRGGVSIAKWDIELNVENATQGDATLKGAEFTIYNKSKESVLVDTDGDGEVETYEPGDEIIVLVTDKEGKVSTKGDFLPYGTYEITETKSPEGYTYFGENITRTVQIREDGKIYPFIDKTTATKNRVIRGDIEILKFKGDLSTEEPDDRVTSLSGIQFEISLKSSGDVVTTITTDSRGYATTESSEYPYGRLPYGLYVIHEVEESIPEGIAPVDDFEVFIGRTDYVIGTIDSDATVFGDNNEYVDGNVYKGYYLNDRQAEMPIRVVKVSTESNEVIPLEGFTFQILDKNKDVVEFHLRYPHNQVVTEFTTDETGEAVLPEKLPYGTYYVHELEAPYGCILSKDLEFKVTSWSSWDNILEVRFPDDFAKGKVVITKYDKNTNTVLEGATFDIYANEDIITPDKVLRHSKGDYIETVTIGADGTGTSSELYLGKYYFVETYAPNGFLLEENKTEFELVYEDDKTPIVYEYRDIYDKPIRFELYKYDIDGEELEGVTFKIEKVEDIEYTVTETSTDTPNPDTISGGTFVTDENGLITKDYWLPGIYSVTETATLPGYVLDDTVRYFKVEANGTISEVYNTEEGEEESEGLDADWYSNTVDSTGNVNKLTLSWKNDYTKWDFSKVDVTGDTELVGAEMEIYNSDNELVYSWTSDGELHRINKIPLGDYTLVEKTAPKGYVIASAVPFTVINTGVVQKATMIDKIVEAYKVDESGNGVVGATMVVYKQDEADSSGVFIDEVDRWVTDGTAHRIENLVVGKTYQLVEEKSPEGWVLSTPVTFTVYDDFKDQEVAMADIRVKAHKYDETLETYVEGAKLQVIDSADNVVDEWVTTDEFHYISGLVAGKSYTLVEVAAPEGFALAKPVNFTVEDNGKDQEVVMVNKKVLVSKVDTEVKELAGAELEVRDSEGNVIDKWVSDGTPHAIIGLVVGETYTLVETKAPEGYAIATPIEFTVADNAKNDTIDLINKQVFVTKTDVTGEKEIEGATLIVYDKEGNEVDKWVSGSEAHPISNIVVGETYVLHEELAPEGYVIASDIEFTVMDDFKVQQVVMKDKQVFVTKKSVTGEDELPGAELYVVEKETGKEVDSWTSGTEAHAVSGLEVGKNYTLIEKTAPMGYVIATEVDFYVADDFTIQTVEMLDKQVFMHKHDVTGEKEIPGANIVVTDKETGDVVDRWTSGEEPHAISGLVVNKTYILHEELAPEGYVIASDVEFTVLDDFKVQTVEMKDKQVFVSKKSVTGTSELEGATLSVYDEEGKVVDTWVSGKEEHAVSGLVVGKTYTLVEEIAPSGYVVAEKITFTVEDDFTIQHVEMLDKQVFVSKKDVTGDNELPGAKLTVIDKETGEKVDEWISTEEEHPVSGLEVKKTYILIEETAPEGFVVAEQIEFTVEDDFTIQHVEMSDKQVFVSKQDITTGEEIGGAHLQVVDKDGNIIDEWVSEEGVQHPISGLVVGETYTLIETLAPDGYVTAEDIEFTVLDDFQIQEVVMLDDYTKVEISKQDATTGKELPGAKLVLYNEDGDIVDEWTSGDEPHYIEYLPVGKYTLHEDLAPVGYEIANDVEFEVEDTGEVQQVVMKDEPTPVVKKIAQTGENMIIFVSAGIAVLIALIGLFLVLKKRKRNA